MGLNAAVQERIEAMNITDPLTKQINIKMSGCPNGCGQHHIGTIGFYGASIKVGEHTIPAYIPHVGGNFERRRGRLRQAPEAAPAREAGAGGRRALDPLLRGGAQRGRGLQRRSPSASAPRSSRSSAKDLTLPIEFNLDNMNFFIDWARNEPYQVIRGEGECAV